MAKDSIATPLTQFIGTGPYMFKERKPDQYVQLVRFDGYNARKEPASGYAGQRVALLDDLLATGGTVRGTIELVERLEGQIVGLAFLVELLFLKGRDRLQGFKTTSVIQY